MDQETRIAALEQRMESLGKAVLALQKLTDAHLYILRDIGLCRASVARTSNELNDRILEETEELWDLKESLERMAAELAGGSVQPV